MRLSAASGGPRARATLARRFFSTTLARPRPTAAFSSTHFPAAPTRPRSLIHHLKTASLSFSSSSCRAQDAITAAITSAITSRDATSQPKSTGTIVDWSSLESRRRRRKDPSGYATKVWIPAPSGLEEPAAGASQQPNEPDATLADDTSQPHESTGASEDASSPYDTIHILGSNPRTNYIAFHLAGMPRLPPVRLLFTGDSMLEKWEQEGSEVKLIRGGRTLRRDNIEVELISAPHDSAYSSSARDDGHIRNLIVTMPCSKSIGAILRLKHRIDSRTNLCLIQAGMGVPELLNEICFPDPRDRPSYILGHMTHDLGYTGSAFTVQELAPNKLQLTAYRLFLPPEDVSFLRREKKRRTKEIMDAGGRAGGPLLINSDEITARNRERYNNRGKFLQTLALTPLLGAGRYHTGSLLKAKFTDVIYTAAVEPVATVLRTGIDEGLWNNPDAYALVKQLISEMVAVVAKLPETKRSSDLSRYVEDGSMQRNVVRHFYKRCGGKTPGVARGGQAPEDGDAGGDVPLNPTRTGFCLMRHQVDLGITTDIQYLNGYFVRRGKQLGIKCPANEMIMRLVRAQVFANRAKISDFIPLLQNGEDAGEQTVTMPPSDPPEEHQWASAAEKFVPKRDASESPRVPAPAPADPPSTNAEELQHKDEELPKPNLWGGLLPFTETSV